MRILLVDDEARFLAVTKEMLERAGHTVLLADDGKVAREIVTMESVDLIISDVMMPALDGVRFHSYVREFMPNNSVPFIFLSGAQVVPGALVRDPAQDFFLSKASSPQNLLDLVGRLGQPGVLPQL